MSISTKTASVCHVIPELGRVTAISDSLMLSAERLDRENLDCKGYIQLSF